MNELNELQDFEYLKFQYHKENLHDVFGTVLDTFPNIKDATVTGQIYLWELFQKIKYNFADDIDVEHLLTDKYIDGVKNPVYEEKKKKLPAVCYNAVFYEYKNIENVRHVTNLMFLDIDDFGSYDEVTKYKNHITKKYDWIVACNLSLSRLGLHVIILVDNITGNNDFNSKYDYISTTYFDGMLDPVSKSLSRYAVIPADFNIYINENPKVLEIDKILNQEEKGIRSAYNTNDEGIEKGIRSAYNTNDEGIEKGIRSAYNKREEIYTPYTICSNSSLNQMMNDSSRKQNLIFRQSIAESSFKDPNIPLYFPEGIEVMELNLFALKDGKLRESRGTSAKRLSFLGSITVKLIYLNAVNPVKPIKEVRRAILRFVISINKEYCEPPVPHREVLNSFNANWKKFKARELDFSNYYTKKKAFWSKQSTLSANEKRSVTCKIKNAPIVEDTKRRIWEAIETLNASGQKTTQQKVAGISGLSLAVVKKYRNEYHEYKKMLIGEPDILEIEGDIIEISEKPDVDTSKENLVISNNTNLFLENDCFELLDINVTDFKEERTTHISASEETDSVPEYTEDQLQLLFQRIFNSLQNQIAENTKVRLYEQFLNYFHELPASDAKLLIKSPENISDSDEFWKQFTLERKMWSLCTEKLPNKHF